MRTEITQDMKWHYLYNFGATEGDECAPKIHTLPTTNHTAKKQSKAILKWSTTPLSLQMKNDVSTNDEF